eukprot:4659724-Pleurochrysis_carterae.AAC.1
MAMAALRAATFSMMEKIAQASRRRACDAEGRASAGGDSASAGAEVEVTGDTAASARVGRA